MARRGPTFRRRRRPRVPPTEYVEAYTYRAIELCQKREFDLGMLALKKALALDPSNPVVLTNRGVVWFLKGQVKKALGDFSRALRRDPELAGAYYNRAQAHEFLGHLAPAIADYTRVLRREPEHRKALNNRGVLYVRMGRLGEALEDFDRSLRLGDDEEIYFNRGLARILGGDVDGARQDLQKALEFAPENWPFTTNAQRMLGRLQEMQ